MDDLYNVVLQTYETNFESLSLRTQFHLSSRLYLWNREPMSRQWLEKLRPTITLSDNPNAALKALLGEVSPVLPQSASVRLPYLTKYPNLLSYLRILFRILFICSVYDVDERPSLFILFSQEELKNLRNNLLSDELALKWLSSFAINYLYILDLFIDDNESTLPLNKFLYIGQNEYNISDQLERQLNCYFYTHSIIGESLFYSRQIPNSKRPIYLQMLLEVQQIISQNLNNTLLDNLFEFLVCCRMLDYTSPLEPAINLIARKCLSKSGYMLDPLKSKATDLRTSEHRNVLFLMSQRPYQPLIKD
jgi:hypothetical protein